MATDTKEQTAGEFSAQQLLEDVRRRGRQSGDRPTRGSDRIRWDLYQALGTFGKRCDPGTAEGRRGRNAIKLQVLADESGVPVQSLTENFDPLVRRVRSWDADDVVAVAALLEDAYLAGGDA